MKIIDGKNIASFINDKTSAKIKELNLNPGLAIILVGNNPASEIYVKNKIANCEKIGIKANLYRFSSENKETEIINCVKKMNVDNNIHGIIIQSPMPKEFRENHINSFISPEKDVDGFGIYNMGLLALNNENYLAATPQGIIKMLEFENIDIKGKNVVIIGRSKIVGRPLALALLNRDATVTIAHSKTENLQTITKKADILIVAIGKPSFITQDYIKENAVVIDVGINRIDGNICGDIDFESVKDKVSYITPVPGGVGPMTIACLLSNVTKSAENFKLREVD